MQATRKLWQYLRPYWRWALLAPLFMVLEVSMDLLQPWLMERIIDDGVAQGDLDRIGKRNIPVDIVLKQRREVLGA